MTSEHTQKSTPLAPEGLYRWTEIAKLLPVSRETWRQRMLAKQAPQSIRIGVRCTVWRGADVLKWLQDPNGYNEVD